MIDTAMGRAAKTPILAAGIGMRWVVMGGALLGLALRMTARGTEAKKNKNRKERRVWNRSYRRAPSESINGGVESFRFAKRFSGLLGKCIRVGCQQCLVPARLGDPRDGLHQPAPATDLAPPACSEPSSPLHLSFNLHSKGATP
ncbi:hypothetical protein VLK31_25185 [Variovorax sp. H27-G14]|uniref:hypothetical protein n=1 Tax=Variovorax sp. H27-G14 TaxID=3111914 RepID=UPI0038FC3FD1